MSLVVRPVLATSSGTAGQPLVLTQAQLAQLQQSGVLKMANGAGRPAAAPAAGAVTPVTSASIGIGVAGKPIVIKTEPAAAAMVVQTTSPLQATGRPTVLQAVPAAAASNANLDNDVSEVFRLQCPCCHLAKDNIEKSTQE